MTNYPWAPPINTLEDQERILACLQPHMRELAKECARLEAEHDAALALGINSLHRVFCALLKRAEEDMHNGIRAVWS